MTSSYRILFTLNWCWIANQLSKWEAANICLLERGGGHATKVETKFT